MNDLTGKRIGFVVTGSFCTFSAAFAQAKRLRESGAVLTPIFSEHAAGMDTRFGTAALLSDFIVQRNLKRGKYRCTMGL